VRRNCVFVSFRYAHQDVMIIRRVELFFALCRLFDGEISLEETIQGCVLAS
jgi:hypothetical protein